MSNVQYVLNCISVHFGSLQQVRKILSYRSPNYIQDFRAFVNNQSYNKPYQTLSLTLRYRSM